jgi:hypothetical protein
MTVNHQTLPDSLRQRITATKTFCAVQALIEGESDPGVLHDELARLTKQAGDSLDAADWLAGKGLTSYARPCAVAALAAACGADLLGRNLTPALAGH